MTRISAGARLRTASGQASLLAPPPMRETGRGGLQSSVTALLATHRWDYVYHAVQSFTQRERGQPDVFAVRVRDRRILLAELKGEGKRATARQAEVLEILRGVAFDPDDYADRAMAVLRRQPVSHDPAGHTEAWRSWRTPLPRIEVYLWTPDDWRSGEIEKVLR